MHDKRAKLEPDCTYHIFTRANGSEKLFITKENYRFFLERYGHYIQPLAETFCYCLMPNHFHFLVRIKGEKELTKYISAQTGSSKTLQGFGTLEGLERQSAISKFLSQRFSHLLNGFTQAFNKQQGRKGSLFMHPFKRKKVTDDKYLLKLIHYIHFNPIEAGLAQEPEDWKFSSYCTIISSAPTWLSRTKVIDCFGSLENFIHCHTYPPEITGIEDLYP